jgi:hypothetical protein
MQTDSDVARIPAIMTCAWCGDTGKHVKHFEYNSSSFRHHDFCNFSQTQKDCMFKLAMEW